MPFLSKVLSFWNNLFRQRDVERDLNDELQAWVEEIADRKIQSGFDPETAREAALLELGSMERIKDLVRDQRIGFANFRRAGVTSIVAVVAFICGAAAAGAVLRWKVSEPAARVAVIAPEKMDTAPLPVLEGRLVDSATGQPIPFVEIGIKEWPIRRFTYSDENGYFMFTNPPQSPYGLEAGERYWSVNEGGFANFRQNRPGDSFEFLGPSEVSVKDKTGQPSEGERVEFRGRTSKGTPYPPPGKELRRFRYGSSVIELRADNLSPGKLASR
jgi:hypothetical protein